MVFRTKNLFHVAEGFDWSPRKLSPGTWSCRSWLATPGSLFTKLMTVKTTFSQTTFSRDSTGSLFRPSPRLFINPPVVLLEKGPFCLHGKTAVLLSRSRDNGALACLTRSGERC